MWAYPPKEQACSGWVWKVIKAMNGSRTASADFNDFLSGILTTKMNFRQGVMETCLFIAVNSKLRVLIHVDDPIAVGDDGLAAFWKELQGYVLIRDPTRITVDKPGKYLARTYTWFQFGGRRATSCDTLIVILTRALGFTTSRVPRA